MADEASQKFHEKFLGRTMEVLFEQEHEGYTEGLTTNYIRVYVPGKIESGTLCEVRLNELFRDGIVGEVIVK